jgi:hypothetical protein
MATASAGRADKKLWDVRPGGSILQLRRSRCTNIFSR